MENIKYQTCVSIKYHQKLMQISKYYYNTNDRIFLYYVIHVSVARTCSGRFMLNICVEKTHVVRQIYHCTKQKLYGETHPVYTLIIVQINVYFAVI